MSRKMGSIKDVMTSASKKVRGSSDFDSSMGGKIKRRRHDKPDKKLGRGSAWDQLQRRTPETSDANRNVHDTQQLDRSTIGEKRTEALPNTLSAIVGILSMVLVWIVWGLLGFLSVQFSSMSTPQEIPEDAPSVTKATELGVAPYFTEESRPWGPTLTKQCYIPIDQAGTVIEPDACYDAPEDVDRPQWHVDATVAAMQAAGMEVNTEQADTDDSIMGWLLFDHMSFLRVVVTLAGAMAAGFGLREVLLRQLNAQNALYDTTDINQYEDDQHIALPGEVIRKFTIVPDVGAHFPAAPSSLISHVMLSNKGVDKVDATVFADSDIIDEKTGEVIYKKGEPVYNDDGTIKTKRVPMFDIDFAHELYSASGIPKNKEIRRFFDPSSIEHNPDGKDRDKTGSQALLAEHINETWTLPWYEPQRPGGAYLVDEAPVNTMVLAITRGGKGQTYIEPMIDIWTREQNPNNFVANDPKGELLVKNYVRACMRGFEVIQFNLINSDKTDVYNPLGMAAEAAREGDSTKCALYVENIAEVFFPVDGADDPVWPSAANNAFKRAAYGLIDFYLEEERQLRDKARLVGMDAKVLENKIDVMWGKVTLFNCYQLFVQLSAKKLKSPLKRLEADLKDGKFGDVDADIEASEKYANAKELAELQEPVWEGNDELDALTLFFNATDQLPKNSMRRLVGDADKSLRAMGAAEKMLASVYGIAITAMSFFSDPTISTLTSGTLSQNTDLAGFSFPRRIGVRFNPTYIERYNLRGAEVHWSAFEDAGFTKQMDSSFSHEDTVSREGWARYYPKGIFPKDVAYLRLQLRNPGNGTLMKTFYFRFVKLYQTNLSGRTFVKNPVTGQKVVRNGVLTELRPVTKNGTTRYVSKSTTFSRDTLNLSKIVDGGQINPSKATPEKGHTDVIMQTQARYSQQPKALFLVTPPHLMKYAKLLLIAVKQLVDLNFDQSYMTKSNQKPLYKTRFMLDELGNLQSEGHGIANFQTMLSIGLGQEQQFTLILQTLQQLRDVYGESVDKIVQGNTSNIVFLKSTDDSMIDTLQKMSGTTHRAYKDSKTITRDATKLMLENEGKISYTMTVKEEPVISYNNLASLPERNSIVFRAGDSVIWNRNETILPMSWRLFKNSIKQPGDPDKEYSLKTIPTMSSSSEFDVRTNQPNFMNMLEKRMMQAAYSPRANSIYTTAYDVNDYEMSRMDPDVLSNELMEITDSIIAYNEYKKVHGEFPDNDDEALREREEMEDMGVPEFVSSMEDNEDVITATAEQAGKAKEHEQKIYARGSISRDMLVSLNGFVTDTLDGVLAAAYDECVYKIRDDATDLRVDDSNALYGPDGTLFIGLRDRRMDDEDIETLKSASEDEDSRVFSGGDIPDTDDAVQVTLSAAERKYRITDAFKRWLVTLDSWKDIADGEFDIQVAKFMEV